MLRAAPSSHRDLCPNDGTGSTKEDLDASFLGWLGAGDRDARSRLRRQRHAAARAHVCVRALRMIQRLRAHIVARPAIMLVAGLVLTVTRVADGSGWQAVTVPHVFDARPLPQLFAGSVAWSPWVASAARYCAATSGEAPAARSDQ